MVLIVTISWINTINAQQTGCPSVDCTTCTEYPTTDPTRYPTQSPLGQILPLVPTWEPTEDPTSDPTSYPTSSPLPPSMTLLYLTFYLLMCLYII